MHVVNFISSGDHDEFEVVSPLMITLIVVVIVMITIIVVLTVMYIVLYKNRKGVSLYCLHYYDIHNLILYSKGHP